MIYLREITEKDIEVINIWRNDLNLIDLLGANFRYINIETDREWFNNYMRNRLNQVRCSICLKENDELVGLVSLTSIDNLNKQAEFHIMIGNDEHQNKGYGKFAIKEMLKHAFNNLNLNRVYLYVLSNNLRAINAYSKTGS
jgi:RimJ/RimL family protein N-acetyltransferase